jgi:hypothetical protein
VRLDEVVEGARAFPPYGQYYIPGMNEDKTKPVVTPKPANPPQLPKEIGGPKGPEPTRYGDWEQKGRCTDF